MTRRRGMSLAGQYLVLQLLIVLAVLVAVVAISLAQSAAAFERIEGRRALSAAEALGNNPTVRALLPAAEPRGGSALPAVAESVRTVSGSSQVALARLDRTVVASSDPGLLGQSAGTGREPGDGGPGLDRRGGRQRRPGTVRPRPGPGRRRKNDRHRLHQPELPVHLGAAGRRRAQPAHVPGRGQRAGRGRLAAAGPPRQAADPGHGTQRNHRAGGEPRGHAARAEGGGGGSRPARAHHRGQ